MQLALQAGRSRRVRIISRVFVHKRCMHSSLTCHAVTNLEMPAMSPTMTEGGISQWKKKDGEVFSVGDVLLEIETDKATIDVEAQDDGIIGKILSPDGTKNIPVGKIIALLAEEGDDISNLRPPADEPKLTRKPQEPPQPASYPTPYAEPKATLSSSHTAKHVEHTRPLFPSVLRLLQEHSVPNMEKIKGSGVRGMLTKGDVLAHLGMASSPTGTYKETKPEHAMPSRQEEVKPLDGPSIRRLIVSNLLSSSVRLRTAAAPALDADFDSIIADYLPPTKSSSFSVPMPPKSTSHSDYFEGLI